MEQPRPGEARERPEVDVDVVELVEAGDQAGQHPGVGRMEIARDDRDPHAGNGTHPQPAQHDDVTVAAADEDEILEDGGAGAVRHGVTPARASTRFMAVSNRSGSGSRLVTRNASRGKSKK